MIYHISYEFGKDRISLLSYEKITRRELEGDYINGFVVNCTASISLRHYNIVLYWNDRKGLAASDSKLSQFHF